MASPGASVVLAVASIAAPRLACSLRVEGHDPVTPLCPRALLAGGGQPRKRTARFLNCRLCQLVGLLVAVDADMTGDPVHDHANQRVSFPHRSERVADREADCLAGGGSGVDRALDGRKVVSEDMEGVLQ